jgi:hypothetical protein
MNTNDLPPAAKLAVLIEAGRAANPDLKHGQGTLLERGAACAMGFAALGAGLSRAAIDCTDPTLDKVHAAYALIGKALDLHEEGHEPQVLKTWVWGRVIRPNDNGLSLEDICRSLRESVAA